ncbi:endonuclease/exonuclease/phosphatase family protein [Xanthobacter sp. AM11]|uniref:endonuclease/exonuclease/phosphatase family protein n=1 Tax=Xanthobacter sp. AM11 TaxID=3380643 RepID=UPI0039BFEE0E
MKLRFILGAVLAILGLASALTLLDSILWVADELNFFRPAFFSASVAVFLGALATRSRRLISFTLVLVAFNALPLVLRTIPVSSPAAEGTQSVRVMSANVLVTNTDYAAFRRLVSLIRPDVLLTQEATGDWPHALKEIAFLPYWATEPGSRAGLLIGGIQIVSRFPLEVTRFYPLAGGNSNPVSREVAARVTVRRPGSKPFVIFAIHPPSPRSFLEWQRRELYLDEIVRRVGLEAVGTSVLVVGDWNTPPWSPLLRRFARETGLVATEALPWPSATRILASVAGVSLLGSPIDRIMASKEVGLSALHLGAAFGSDHRPVYADLTIP